MSEHFSTIAYTPSVRAAQRQFNGIELSVGSADAVAELGPREREFIARRDSFFLATVSETGWPHVQHRGGPAGFLHVLGASTLGFADYAGNRQYVSVGNLTHNDRAALILMDYPHRQRLKILGHVQAIYVDQAEPALLSRLAVAGSNARIERLMLIQLAAFDWNCSRHITPRYTADEWEAFAD